MFDLINPESSHPYLRCGVIGSAASIPAGFATETILHVGNAPGLSRAYMSWGDGMLRKYAKARAAPDVNVHVEKLGYSTVGHYFYGIDKGR